MGHRGRLQHCYGPIVADCSSIYDRRLGSEFWRAIREWSTGYGRRLLLRSPFINICKYRLRTHECLLSIFHGFINICKCLPSINICLPSQKKSNNILCQISSVYPWVSVISSDTIHKYLQISLNIRKISATNEPFANPVVGGSAVSATALFILLHHDLRAGRRPVLLRHDVRHSRLPTSLCVSIFWEGPRYIYAAAVRDRRLAPAAIRDELGPRRRP